MLQEAQFEQLTRELEVERQSVANQLERVSHNAISMMSLPKCTIYMKTNNDLCLFLNIAKYMIMENENPVAHVCNLKFKKERVSHSSISHPI